MFEILLPWCMADEKYDNNTHKYNSQIVLLFPTMYFHVGSPYRHRHLSTVTLFDILIDLEIRIFEMTNNYNHPFSENGQIVMLKEDATDSYIGSQSIAIDQRISLVPVGRHIAVAYR